MDIRRPGPAGLELLAVFGARGAIPSHLHASWCVVAVRTGERTVTSADTTLVLRPGEAAVIPPGLAHGCASPSEGCDFLAASVNPGLLPSWMGNVALSGPLRLPSGSLLPTALDQAMGASPKAALALPGLLESEIRAVCPGEGIPRKPAAVEPMVRKAMAVLDGPGADEADLEKLSRQAGASQFHLARRFKKATGIAPGEYRTLALLRRARALLNHGAPLAEVAAACGFFDQSHLNLRFKKYMGMTPGQYARACR